MSSKRSVLFRTLFWLALGVFLAWDWQRAAPVDLRREPPAIAAGSGQQVVAGHCSMSD